MRRVNVQDVLSAVNVNDIAIAGAVTVYTRSFLLTGGDYFSLSYKATSVAGAPDLKIELEQSFQLPTTEGVSDTNWVKPEGMSNIESNLTTETMHHKALTPITLPYGRFKITGNAGNNVDTTIRLRINQQEEF